MSRSSPVMEPRPRSVTWRRPFAAAIIAAALAVLAGCGNGESPESKRPHTGTATASVVDAVQQLVVTTGPDLRFHPSTLVVHPGKVRIVLKNVAKNGNGPPHNLQFAGLPVSDDVPTTFAGGSRSVTFTAPAPGTYRFVCSFHVAQGQTGTLVVR